jgi:hypothetical protein
VGKQNNPYAHALHDLLRRIAGIRMLVAVDDEKFSPCGRGRLITNAPQTHNALTAHAETALMMKQKRTCATPNWVSERA